MTKIDPIQCYSLTSVCHFSLPIEKQKSVRKYDNILSREASFYEGVYVRSWARNLISFVGILRATFGVYAVYGLVQGYLNISGGLICIQVLITDASREAEWPLRVNELIIRPHECQARGWKKKIPVIQRRKIHVSLTQTARTIMELTLCMRVSPCKWIPPTASG